MDVRVGLWRKLSAEELMLLNCGVGEDSWGSLGLQGHPTNPFWRRSVLGFLWKKWCWSWNSSTLATSCEELTHWKRLWCWEGLGAGGEGDDRGWDGWMGSLTWWTWVWVNSGSWWRTGRPGCDSWGRKESDTTEQLNWTEEAFKIFSCLDNRMRISRDRVSMLVVLKAPRVNLVYRLETPRGWNTKQNTRRLFSNNHCSDNHVCLSHVWLCVTLRTIGFPRQGYWSVLPFPSPSGNHIAMG